MRLYFSKIFSGWKNHRKAFNLDDKITSHMDARVNVDNAHADNEEVFLTKCLKEFLFTEYLEENFLGRHDLNEHGP